MKKPFSPERRSTFSAALAIGTGRGVFRFVLQVE